MTSDFSIIIQRRQRFGDERDPNEFEAETMAPFVGSFKEFPFVCENLDRSQGAVLQFQSLGVSDRSNIIRINGFDLAGGIPTSVDRVIPPSFQDVVNFQIWNSNTLLIPRYVLGLENILRIESRPILDTNNLDNFIIDNAVVFFKTRTSRIPQFPGYGRDTI